MGLFGRWLVKIKYNRLRKICSSLPPKIELVERRLMIYFNNPFTLEIDLEKRILDKIGLYLDLIEQIVTPQQTKSLYISLINSRITDQDRKEVFHDYKIFCEFFSNIWVYISKGDLLNAICISYSLLNKLEERWTNILKKFLKKEEKIKKTKDTYIL